MTYYGILLVLYFGSLHVTKSQDGHIKIDLNLEWYKLLGHAHRFFGLFVKHHNRNGNE